MAQCLLRGPHPAWHQSGRAAGPVPDQVRSSHQPQNRQGHGLDDSRSFLAACRRADRIKRRGCLLLARTASSPQRSAASAIRGSGGPLLALDLGAVHDPARIRVERVASVHGAAIVPQDEIADAPDVLPGEFRPIDEAPQLVEQRLGLLEFEAQPDRRCGGGRDRACADWCPGACRPAGARRRAR